MSQKLTEEERNWKNLAIARYAYFPKNLYLCVGRHSITDDQAIYEIKRESELGKFLVRVEKFYLQNIKEIDWKKT